MPWFLPLYLYWLHSHSFIPFIVFFISLLVLVVTPLSFSSLHCKLMTGVVYFGNSLIHFKSPFVFASNSSVFNMWSLKEPTSALFYPTNSCLQHLSAWQWRVKLILSLFSIVNRWFESCRSSSSQGTNIFCRAVQFLKSVNKRRRSQDMLYYFMVFNDEKLVKHLFRSTTNAFWRENPKRAGHHK